MSLLSSLRTNIQRKEVTRVAEFNTEGGPEFDKFMRTTSYASGYGWGGSVTIDKAFCLAAFLTCVKIIAEDVGSLPLFVNRRRGGSSDVDPLHSLYSKLHDSPNPDMTALQFREALTAHALTCGKAYGNIEFSRNDSSRIIALWPMQPQQVTRDKDLSGKPVFIEMDSTGKTKTYTRKQVFEITGFGTTGTQGLNMLQYMRESIGLGTSQQAWASRFFEQSQIPPLVLEHPLQTDVAAVKKAWEEAHKGAKNWHGPAVLQEGMKANLLQYDVSKTQLNEQRSFQLLEICRPFRMPPHKLGELGRATWGNIGAQNTQYYTECLRPWLVRWEQSINLFILGDDYPEWYAEHEIGGMLRGDFTQQTEGFRTLQATGVYSINEVRGLLNLNKIAGGDEHFIQLNQGTVQRVAEGVAQQQQLPVQVGANKP
jgi:HK97 family phage portal protein